MQQYWVARMMSITSQIHINTSAEYGFQCVWNNIDYYVCFEPRVIKIVSTPPLAVLIFLHYATTLTVTYNAIRHTSSNPVFVFIRNRKFRIERRVHKHLPSVKYE